MSRHYERKELMDAIRLLRLNGSEAPPECLGLIENFIQDQTTAIEAQSIRLDPTGAPSSAQNNEISKKLTDYLSQDGGTVSLFGFVEEAANMKGKPNPKNGDSRFILLCKLIEAAKGRIKLKTFSRDTLFVFILNRMTTGRGLEPSVLKFVSHRLGDADRLTFWMHMKRIINQDALVYQLSTGNQIEITQTDKTTLAGLVTQFEANPTSSVGGIVSGGNDPVSDMITAVPFLVGGGGGGDGVSSMASGGGGGGGAQSFSGVNPQMFSDRVVQSADSPPIITPSVINPGVTGPIVPQTPRVTATGQPSTLGPSLLISEDLSTMLPLFNPYLVQVFEKAMKEWENGTTQYPEPQDCILDRMIGSGEEPGSLRVSAEIWLLFNNDRNSVLSRVMSLITSNISPPSPSVDQYDDEAFIYHNTDPTTPVQVTTPTFNNIPGLFVSTPFDTDINMEEGGFNHVVSPGMNSVTTPGLATSVTTPVVTTPGLTTPVVANALTTEPVASVVTTRGINPIATEERTKPSEIIELIKNGKTFSKHNQGSTKIDQMDISPPSTIQKQVDSTLAISNPEWILPIARKSWCNPFRLLLDPSLFILFGMHPDLDSVYKAFSYDHKFGDHLVGQLHSFDEESLDEAISGIYQIMRRNIIQAENLLCVETVITKPVENSVAHTLYRILVDREPTGMTQLGEVIKDSTDKDSSSCMLLLKMKATQYLAELIDIALLERCSIRELGHDSVHSMDIENTSSTKGNDRIPQGTNKHKKSPAGAPRNKNPLNPKKSTSTQLKQTKTSRGENVGDKTRAGRTSSSRNDIGTDDRTGAGTEMGEASKPPTKTQPPKVKTTTTLTSVLPPVTSHERLQNVTGPNTLTTADPDDNAYFSSGSNGWLFVNGPIAVHAGSEGDTIEEAALPQNSKFLVTRPVFDSVLEYKVLSKGYYHPLVNNNPRFASLLWRHDDLVLAMSEKIGD